jgi:hypothetical protein
VIGHHGFRQRRPHVAGVGKAVQHHDGGAFAADPDVDLRIVGLHHLRAE